MKIQIVIPYLGKIPDLGILSLQQLDAVENINLHIITDNDEFETINKIIKNGCVHKFKNIFIQKNVLNINEDIIINSPYKLCDFKPFFNLLFKIEELNNCEFWGWADIDCIFNISYLNNAISKLEINKVYGNRGHLMILSSVATKKIQKVFLTKSKRLKIELFNTNRHFALDEFLFFHRVLEEMHVLCEIVWEKNFFMSILDLDYKHLIPQNYVKSINFDFYNIYYLEKNLFYIHFQKRKFILANEFNKDEKYYINIDYLGNVLLNNVIIENKFSIYAKIKYYINVFFNRVKTRIKNHGIVKRPKF